MLSLFRQNDAVRAEAALERRKFEFEFPLAELHDDGSYFVHN